MSGLGLESKAVGFPGLGCGPQGLRLKISCLRFKGCGFEAEGLGSEGQVGGVRLHCTPWKNVLEKWRLEIMQESGKHKGFNCKEKHPPYKGGSITNHQAKSFTTLKPSTESRKLSRTLRVQNLGRVQDAT